MASDHSSSSSESSSDNLSSLNIRADTTESDDDAAESQNVVVDIQPYRFQPICIVRIQSVNKRRMIQIMKMNIIEKQQLNSN